MADEAPKRTLLARFTYDVGVSVLANLVAAAAIYLAAVGTGYLSRSPKLEVFALMVLGAAATVLLVNALTHILRNHVVWYLIALLVFASVWFPFLLFVIRYFVPSQR